MTEKISTQGMLDTFLFECEQLLEQIQKIILEEKDKECYEEESIHEIFRAMHTIKGISGMMITSAPEAIPACRVSQPAL